MRQGEYWARLDERLIDWIGKALRRKPTGESRVAASLRAAALFSAPIRGVMVDAVEVLIRRRAYDRPLYAASVRALAEAGHERVGALLAQALRCESWGGLATLSAATHCPSMVTGDALVRAAAARRPEIAFGAELVRALRREARRAVLMDAAARLKESARIELCTQLLAPLLLLRGEPVELPASVAPAMGVLRGSERHLGRWLVFALASVQGGDSSPLEEALERSATGSSSARTAWSLLAWVLSGTASPPDVKPTVEIVARLSDRPTAERDMSFLFRLAETKSEGARVMLETLCAAPLKESASVRAAAVLARAYGSERARGRLREIADNGQRATLRGLAVAGLWDAGERAEARERAEELRNARALPNAVWGGLVMRAVAVPIITERSFRYLERGWVE